MVFQRNKKVASKSASTDLLPKIDKRKTMPHLQKKGMPSLNPAGRPKGSRNKLGEAFLSALLEDFNEHGEEAIADCRKEDPATYCRIIAGILPKEINITDEEKLLEKFLEQFTSVEEIRTFRSQLAVLASAGVSDGQIISEERAKALPRK